MSYQERLRNYERDKRELNKKPLTAQEYERELSKIRKKWKV